MAIVGAALTACTTDSGTFGAGELPANAACCASYAGMKYATLTLDQAASAELRSGSAVHEFADGRSYYRAFALPAHAGPVKLAFRTYVRGLIPYATVVRPQFVFLDPSKSEIARKPDPPVFPGSDFFRGAFFKGEVDVPGNAAYVIVHTSDRPATPWNLYSENGTPWAAMPSMTGSLRIVVKNR
jgi:maltose operon protein